MNIGTLIKVERNRRNMKLENLAKDICSTSHLSRIENGKSEPGDEIAFLLLERLGISVYDERQEQLGIDSFGERLEHIVNLRDSGGAEKLILDILNLVTKGRIDFQTRINLELMILRLQLVMSQQAKDVLLELPQYFKLKQGLEPLQTFRIYQIEGMASYAMGNLKGCLIAFDKAEKQIESVSLSSFEDADFAYVSAVAYMADGQTYKALEKSKQALPYFQRIMAGRRVVECHIISGISYKNMGQLSRAIQDFKLAEQICYQFDIHLFLGMLNQNIGDVYSTMGDSESAILYFEQAVNHKEQPNELMYSIFSLIKENEKLENWDTVLHWVNRGISLLTEMQGVKKEYYSCHFNVYQALCLEEKIEDVLIKAVRTFKQMEQENSWKEYAKRLAEMYTKNGKYKKAVSYYKMIVD
ncbi:helix-turn-helix domain-containing protein [Sporosarcina saromensis]|uniref:Helix-turn-helix domain-containing protein n=1 Tax=Sporosarcina saromensis TaxID=359365 RepID=A0ABU4G6X5_9BACL|nr:helix-turn-helix domain-containing protein [Sporosarcina saromensis]MDW0112724.1 helix-turn-helix domain-containing protein [Sporosarcina saromensis]